MIVMQRFGLHSYFCCMPVWLMFMCTLGALSGRLGTQAFSLLLLLNGSQYQVSWQSWSYLSVCRSIAVNPCERWGSLWSAEPEEWNKKRITLQSTHAKPAPHALISCIHLHTSDTNQAVDLKQWVHKWIWREKISGQNVNAIGKGCCISEFQDRMCSTLYSGQQEKRAPTPSPHLILKHQHSHDNFSEFQQVLHHTCKIWFICTKTGYSTHGISKVH